MIEVDAEELPPAQWTEVQALHHLTGTFDQACRIWPDLMQPCEVMLVDATDEASKTEIMRTGLRETISARFPLKHSI